MLTIINASTQQNLITQPFVSATIMIMRHRHRHDHAVVFGFLRQRMARLRKITEGKIMRVAIVKASELSKANRWDVSFHIVAQELADRAAKLQAKLEDSAPEGADKSVFARDTAKAALMRMQTRDLGGLLVLARGQNPAPNREVLARVIEEYPFLSLAITQRDMSKTVARIRSIISENESYLDELQKLGSALNDEPDDSSSFKM